MPANIPPMKHKVPMPKAKDGLGKYYNYNIEDETKIKREKIATRFVITAVISLASGIIAAVLAVIFDSEPLADISLVLFGIMFTSAVFGTLFDDDSL